MVKVLIVAQDLDFCNSLEGFLKRQGYQVTAAYSGQQAIEKAKIEKPQLSLLDINMDDMDGFELLKRFRQIDKEMVITIVTAIKDPEVAQKAIKLGAVNYITKPLDLDLLKRSLEGWARQIESKQLTDVNILALKYEEEKLNTAVSFFTKKGYNIKCIESKNTEMGTSPPDLLILRADLLAVEDAMQLLAGYRKGSRDAPVIITLNSEPPQELANIISNYGKYQYLQPNLDAYGFILAVHGMVTSFQQKKAAKKGKKSIESILVIDDEPGICEYITTFLAKAGYQTSSLNNPRDALDQVQLLKPSLVLLDIVMPDINGLEILKGIRKVSPETCVIIMTGIKDDSICRESLELGACDYLVKPFSLDQLKATILTTSIKSELKII
ncbi:MAG: response regulator [Candidatus Omnitrophica bacterium]|nr:response regulator [Candidatus Omnitrophota bacterium]MDD5238261.1 response regulator [Candidatus Omnitrophota bacterium]